MRILFVFVFLSSIAFGQSKIGKWTNEDKNSLRNMLNIYTETTQNCIINKIEKEYFLDEIVISDDIYNMDVNIKTIIEDCDKENKYLNTPSIKIGHIQPDCKDYNGIQTCDTAMISRDYIGLMKCCHNGKVKFLRVYEKNLVLFKEWYENGQIKSEKNYKYDDYDYYGNRSFSIKHGVHRVWTEDGQIKSEENYINGDLTRLKTWHENGQIIVNYINGDLTRLKTWYENGQIKQDAIYEDYNNKKFKKIIYYYSNGKIMFMHNFETPDGFSKYFLDDGSLAIEINYLNRKKHGHTIFYPKHIKRKSGYFILNQHKTANDMKLKDFLRNNSFESAKFNYKNDVLNGEFITYFKNGKTKFSGQYLNGLKDGIFKEWNDNNNLKSEGNYKNGQKHGVHKEWYYNGHLKQEMTFADDKKSGTWKSYWKNGKLRTEANYVNNKKKGIWREWYNDGVIKSEKEYKKIYDDYILIDAKCWDTQGNLIKCKKY